MQKVITVLGTRPEIIRLSRIIPRLAEDFDHVLVHTGQNTTASLKDVFMKELGLPAPNYDLGLDPSNYGTFVGDLLRHMEDIIRREKPSAALILGDTNSSLCALAFKRAGVPIYHMEAGNRCFDPESPEETNRRIVDAISDFNLVYTEAARRNLLREGHHPQRIYVTGSPLAEVVAAYQDNITRSRALSDLGLAPKQYILASLHRAETVDDPERLISVLHAFETLATLHDLPVVMTAHPRTQQRLEQIGYVSNRWLQLITPTGWFDWCCLQKHAACVVSDSGTISEEAALFGFVGVTPRHTIERPEAMDAGAVIVCGRAPEDIIGAVRVAIGRARRGPKATVPPEYQVPDASWRVSALIAGTHSISRTWMR